MSTIKRWMGHIQIMHRARKMGVLFPEWYAKKTQGAPNGTEEIPTFGNPFKRMRQEYGWFRIAEHNISLPNLQKPLRILQLSDVHLRNADNWLKRLCDSIRGLKADIVVLTGDTITRGWKKEALDLFCNAVPKGDICTVAIMGNWEYWAGVTVTSWRKLLEKYEIQLLCEETFQSEWMDITGTDDHLAGKSQPELWLNKLKPNHPNLVLTHSPAFFPRLDHPSVQLVLAGHAHGGQIRLPFAGALWTPRGTGRYVAGWYQNTHNQLFVSRGLGWSVAPIRFQCPPEIAIINCNPIQAKSF